MFLRSMELSFREDVSAIKMQLQHEESITL